MDDFRGCWLVNSVRWPGVVKVAKGQNRGLPVAKDSMMEVETQGCPAFATSKGPRHGCDANAWRTNF